jgi:hypothetical protein
VSPKAEYPRWRYFPSHTKAPGWVLPLVAVFRDHRKEIDSAVTHNKRMESNDVLRAVADDLEDHLSFTVERANIRPDASISTSLAQRLNAASSSASLIAR